jgi:hypothetical protein
MPKGNVQAAWELAATLCCFSSSSTAGEIAEKYRIQGFALCGA